MAIGEAPENGRPPAEEKKPRIRLGISTKIITPYLILTMAVAVIGTYVVTWLVAGSLHERLRNQLLDSGQAASDSIVRYETERLKLLRQIAYTEGVADAVEADDRGALDKLVRPIAINGKVDVVEIAGRDGHEILGLFHNPNARDVREYDWHANSDLIAWDAVRKVLQGYEDEYGDKLVLLAETADYGLVYYTVGPVKKDDQVVGAVLVGAYINNFAVKVRDETLADVTFYDSDGQVMYSTLGSEVATLRLLELTPSFYQSVLAAQDEILMKDIDVSGRPYRLGFGPWRVRQSVLGVYSVGLPLNFIVQSSSTSRDLIAGLFALATALVVALGYALSRIIVRPILRLVQTSRAVASGDLQQRTGIRVGDEIGVLATSFDRMTASLQERTQQLIEEASRIRAILASIADGVLVLDLDGKIITKNKEGERFLEDMFQDFMAGRLREFQVGDEGQGGGVEMLMANLATLSAYGRLELRRFEVGDRVLGALAAPVITEEGERIGTVLVLRDMTREAEVDRLKDEFIANISHEFRTPLTAIKGYIDLLLMTSRDGMSEQHKKFVQVIDINAKTLIGMINELLDFSQIEAGTLGLLISSFSLTELVAKVVEDWRERINAKGLSLEVYLPDGPLLVQADEARLRWAINNLLSNAYSYTLPGGRVAVSVRRLDGQVQIAIADTGIGISEDDRKYLFTRFFRSGHEEVMKVRGAGLGLYAVKAVAEAHGGRVEVDSELGRGSIFGIVLPEKEAEVAVDELSPAVTERPAY
jgi:signal transduction histidine kinase